MSTPSQASRVAGRVAFPMALACLIAACSTVNETPAPKAAPPAPPAAPVAVAPAAAAPAPAAPSAPSFASQLRLTALMETERGITAGFVHLPSNRSYNLQVGETANGVELVEVDLAAERVRLRHGSEEALLAMSGRVTAPPPGPPSTGVPSSPSYTDRRRMRMLQEQAPTGTSTNRPPASVPPKPTLTGVELQKHLSEYKLEIIRQGLPALPIPLTPDEDAKLVKEGILPPVDPPPAAPAPVP